ncbi:MAG: TlpA disulfide reductase family protein [Pirellulaceae bacterium]
MGELSDYRGKVVLVDFWGTWCKGCIMEFPNLKKLVDALKGKDFEIVGIAQDDAETLKGFLEKKPLPWTNIVDGETNICGKFNIQMFPTTLLIDKEGNHVASNLHGAELVSKLSELLELTDEESRELSRRFQTSLTNS